MCRLRTVCIFIALLLLLAAAPTHAAPTRVSREEPNAQVELAGDGVVYSRANLIRLVRPGQPPHTLRTTPQSSSDDDEECCFSLASTSLAASATRLVTLTYRRDSAKGIVVGSSAALDAAPLEGGPSPVYSCSSGGEYDPGGYDLDGDRLAYVADDCGSGDRRVIIRDLATGADLATIPAPAGQRIWDVRIEGNFVAYQHSGSPDPSAPRQTTVRDIAAGADLYTVSAFTPFDVQADGKLVINSDAAKASGCDSTVDWYSPAEPTRHATGICAASGPRIENDKILVERRAAGSTATDLVLSDLAGNARTLVAAQTPQGLGGFDFDGDRAAYVANTCVPGRADVYLDDLAPAAPVAVGGECPIKPRGTRLRPDSKGRVQLKFSCENGCGGAVSIDRGSNQLSTEANFSGFENAHASVRLTRSARKLLARKRSLRVSVEGTHRVLSSAISGGFTRKVTLLAPRRSG